MKRFLKGLVFAFFATALGASAFAAERGTAEEATALVKKAIAYYKANGRDKTIAEVSNPKGQFVDRDLYLFLETVKPGPLLAHGANQKLIGKDMHEVKDAEGVAFVRKFRETAGSKEGKGWVDYKWIDPISKQIVQKSSYIERVDDIFIGCGIYK